MKKEILVIRTAHVHDPKNFTIECLNLNKTSIDHIVQVVKNPEKFLKLDRKHYKANAAFYNIIDLSNVTEDFIVLLNNKELLDNIDIYVSDHVAKFAFTKDLFLDYSLINLLEDSKQKNNPIDFKPLTDFFIEIIEHNEKSKKEIKEDAKFLTDDEIEKLLDAAMEEVQNKPVSKSEEKIHPFLDKKLNYCRGHELFPHQPKHFGNILFDPFESFSAHSGEVNHLINKDVIENARKVVAKPVSNFIVIGYVDNKFYMDLNPNNPHLNKFDNKPVEELKDKTLYTIKSYTSSMIKYLDDLASKQGLPILSFRSSGLTPVYVVDEAKARSLIQSLKWNKDDFAIWGTKVDIVVDLGKTLWGCSAIRAYDNRMLQNSKDVIRTYVDFLSIEDENVYSDLVKLRSNLKDLYNTTYGIMCLILTESYYKDSKTAKLYPHLVKSILSKEEPQYLTTEEIDELIEIATGVNNDKQFIHYDNNGNISEVRFRKDEQVHYDKYIYKYGILVEIEKYRDSRHMESTLVKISNEDMNIIKRKDFIKDLFENKSIWVALKNKFAVNDNIGNDHLTEYVIKLLSNKVFYIFRPNEAMINDIKSDFINNVDFDAVSNPYLLLLSKALVNEYNYDITSATEISGNYILEELNKLVNTEPYKLYEARPKELEEELCKRYGEESGLVKKDVVIPVQDKVKFPVITVIDVDTVLYLKYYTENDRDKGLEKINNGIELWKFEEGDLYKFNDRCEAFLKANSYEVKPHTIYYVSEKFNNEYLQDIGGSLCRVMPLSLDIDSSVSYFNHVIVAKFGNNDAIWEYVNKHDEIMNYLGDTKLWMVVKPSDSTINNYFTTYTKSILKNIDISNVELILIDAVEMDRIQQMIRHTPMYLNFIPVKSNGREFVTDVERE